MMLYFFAAMICAANIECTEETAFFSVVEITESKDCEKELLDLTKWLMQGANPASERLTLKYTCSLIDQRKTSI